jgi:hypothetical protein
VTSTATPDKTSTLDCDKYEVASGAVVHCTIAARSNNAEVFALASAFALSDGDADGNFGALSGYAAKSFTFTYTAGTNLGTHFISDGISKDPQSLRVIAGAPTPSSQPTPGAKTDVPTSSPFDAPTPSSSEAGGMSSGGVTVIILLVLVAIVVSYLAWRRVQKRNRVDDYITHLQNDEAGEYVAPPADFEEGFE